MPADQPSAVVLVAVVGLSAAGKSTAAHQLARRLHSPLHPVTLDDFFLPSECDRLGTYDDYRTIDFARFVSELSLLKAVMTRGYCEDGSGQESWRARLVEEVPSLAKYLVTELEPSSLPAGTELQKRDSSPGPCEETHAIDSDDSLIAHEEEEAALRACSTEVHSRRHQSWNAAQEGQRPVAPAGSRPGGCTACTAGPTFVVCEGFCLFCSEAVAKADLFDVCVWVRCPLETACQRRFLRAPRRHKPPASNGGGAGGAGLGSAYRARIERLWHSRTESRRQELRDVLARGLGLRQGTLERAEGSEAPALAADSVELLLAAGPASPFFPPPLRRPVSQEGPSDALVGMAPLWDSVTGHPTDAFEALWRQFQREEHQRLEREGTMMGEELAAGNAVASDSAFTLFQQAAAALPADMPQQPPSCPAVLSPPQSTEGPGSCAMLRQRYFEFRYWFFFEVAYYYCLFLPLQAHHIRSCFGPCVDTQEAPEDDASNASLTGAQRRRRLVLSLDNGADASREEMTEKTDRLARTIEQFVQGIFGSQAGIHARTSPQ